MGALADLRAAPRRQLVTSFATVSPFGTAQGGTSLWATGSKVPGGNGATPPSGGENPTRATAGALAHVNAAAGKTARLADWHADRPTANDVTGTFLLYDRLAHNSGLVGNVTSGQDFADLAITRGDTTGADGVEAWLEVYTDIGSTTGATITLDYTSSANVSGRSATISYSDVRIGDVNAMTVFQLQAGDVGVKSVQSVTVSSTTGSAGNFGITLVRRLAVLPIHSQGGPLPAYVKDALATCLPKIDDDACLALVVIRGQATGGNALGFVQHVMTFVEV